MLSSRSTVPPRPRTRLALLACATLVAIVALLPRAGGERRQMMHPASSPSSSSSSEAGDDAAGITRRRRRRGAHSPAADTTTAGARRNAVGGYSDPLDHELLASDEVTGVANFALSEFLLLAAAPPSSSSGGGALLSDAFTNLVEATIAAGGGGGKDDVVRVGVLEARRQVVAGLNYRMTLALLVGEDNICIGGIDGATIYKPLPHTGMGLRVTSWGRALGCDDVSALMGVVAPPAREEEGIAGKEEEAEDEKKNAAAVEGHMEEEREGVEPDA